MEIINPKLSDLVKAYHSQQIRAFLFYGSNIGYVNNLLNGFIKNCDIEFTTLDVDFQLSSLYSLLKNRNLFGEKLCVKISGILGLSNDLKQLIGKLNPEDNFLCLIQSPNFFSQENIRFFAQQRSLLAISCQYVSYNKLKTHIEKFFDQCNRSLDHQILDFLTNYFNNQDYFVIKYQLERFVDTLPKDEVISLNIAQNFFVETKDVNLDQLFFMMIDQSNISLDKFIDLIDNKIIIVRHLIKNYSWLFMLKLLQSEHKNISIDDFNRILRLNLYSKYFKKFLNLATIYSMNNIAEILSILNKLEIKIKNNQSHVNFFHDLFLPVRKIMAIN